MLRPQCCVVLLARKWSWLKALRLWRIKLLLAQWHGVQVWVMCKRLSALAVTIKQP
jgi:hypothetical protein